MQNKLICEINHIQTCLQGCIPCLEMVSLDSLARVVCCCCHRNLTSSVQHFHQQKTTHLGQYSAKGKPRDVRHQPVSSICSRSIAQLRATACTHSSAPQVPTQNTRPRAAPRFPAGGSLLTCCGVFHNSSRFSPKNLKVTMVCYG